MKKLLAGFLALTIVSALLVGCGQSSPPSPENTNSQQKDNAANGNSEEKISGEIVVLTNRTDVVDTKFVGEYAAAFKAKYPDVTVKYEALTDYEGDVKTRMSTSDYGDVLLLPNIPPNELPNFFEPLGTLDEMSEKYLFVDKKAYGGQVYGIPTFGVANGIVYNTKVWKESGITSLPKSPDEFIAQLKQIKEKNPDVIPYYTNLAAGWTMNQWEGHVMAISGDPNYTNTMAHTDDVFGPGTPHYILYKVLFDIASNRDIIEKDPMTSDWETSKQMLADGKVGAMVLGSWAIGQIREIAENPEDVAYMPFPYTVNGKMYSLSEADYCIGINKNTKNMAAAKAYIDWFTNESGYSDYCSGISPIKGAPMPEVLKPFQDLGVLLETNAPPIEGEEGLTDDIAKQAEIGLWDDNWKKPIVEKALQGGDFDKYMSELNEKWKQARIDLDIK